MKLKYSHTALACYNAYITQAITNNLGPLLFVTFEKSLGISTAQLGLLISLNFGTQILVDLICTKLIDKIGYRTGMVASHIFSVIGLIGMSLFPFVFSSPFYGLAAAYIINAIGGGLAEVLVSPTVEALPGDEKEKSMSLLHSFYCFGHVAVVLLSTLYFNTIGIENWRFLPVIWAIIPFLNMFAFMLVPLNTPVDAGEALPLKKLFSIKIFWLFFVLMICSGASEQAMSQWSSMFAEQGLNVSKTTGDLLGPCMFALLMGLSRAFYGKFGEKINLKSFISVSGILCILSYLIAVFAPHPIISLIGCGLCGLSVGIMWPGTFSLASKACPQGGTAMFALLAFAGDIGCMGGPNTVSLFSGTGLKTGLLCAAVFPLVLLLLVKFGVKAQKQTHR